MAVEEEVLRLAEIVPREPGVPHPPGATDAEIAAFAVLDGVTIPPEVRDWLLFTNGPRIGPGGVYGLKDFRKVYGFMPGFKERLWLPLGTDGCGGYYVVLLVLLLDLLVLLPVLRSFHHLAAYLYSYSAS